MPVVTFSHPSLVNSLNIDTGADQIGWAFGLNHVTYPTYGGEVVQILSTYIDDLRVAGTSRSYREMEHIYKWFLSYFQIASQGKESAGKQFVTTPVTFDYPERGWSMKIKPVSLPSYKLGTDVVAPTWSIVSRVVEDDPKVLSLTLDAAAKGLTAFGKMDASLGSNDPSTNPFSNPFPDKSGAAAAAATADAFQKVGDYFTSLVPAYQSGDFSSLLGSGPTDFLNPDRTSTSTAAGTQTETAP